MRYQKLIVGAAGMGVAALIATSAVGAERAVVGEYFTARW